MTFSIAVWGFDTDNDYQHDCDLIKAQNFSEAFNYVFNVLWKGWTFTRIDAELLKDNEYIVKYHDKYTNENYLFNCIAESELSAKIKFRLHSDFSDTKRYTIISVKGVK